MPAYYEWYNEDKTIICEIFEGEWTWQEFSECIQGVAEEMKTVNHDVMILADYTKTNMMPLKGASIKIARDAMQLYPSNWRGLVIVSNNRLIQSMVKLFQSANKTFGSIVYLDNSIEAAVKRIKDLLKKSNNTTFKG
jgi:hypothetical protein